MKRKNPLIKPFLKWAGGKRQLLPEIRDHYPKNVSQLTYYEPFLGAGAVFFDLQPKNAYVNDTNEQLILTFKVIKDEIDSLVDLLIEHQAKNNEDYYYQIRLLDRDEQFQSSSDLEKAARLIYLNKTCYNGLYRVNSQGLFNVPYGKYKNPLVCEEPVLRAINKYLNTNNIVFSSSDFISSVKDADKKSFVYFDPPYHSPDNTNFTGYQSQGFTEKDQIRLRNCFEELSEKGVKCLLSNSDTNFIRELYKDYQIDTVKARRPINSKSAGRGDVNEVLVQNWSD